VDGLSWVYKKGGGERKVDKNLHYAFNYALIGRERKVDKNLHYAFIGR
jgi:hypothetical protein